jgi:hypothetical protein
MAWVARSQRRLLFNLLAAAAVRIGVYVGVSLSLAFTAWLLVANRVPLLEPLSVSRNVVAASILVILACVPLLRFFRTPAAMLLSSMIGWGIFTLTYGSLCLEFSMLDQYYTTSQIFVLGAVIYLLLATLCWIGTIIWKVRATRVSHPRH